MRYQRPFPNVIPHAKVGCSRVTHPSATKLSSSKLSNNSVRLECVMHAASVHPEPGSNSRLIVLKSLFRVFQSYRAFFQLLLLFCLSSILFQNLTRYFFRTILSCSPFRKSSLCTSSISCCSIFNDRFLRCPQMYSFVIISQQHLICQYLF